MFILIHPYSSNVRPYQSLDGDGATQRGKPFLQPERAMHVIFASIPAPFVDFFMGAS